MEFDHAVNDALMRFFDQCTRFLDEVDNNPSALTEQDKFKQGPEMKRAQQKIADRLGVPYNVITYGQWRRCYLQYVQNRRKSAYTFKFLLDFAILSLQSKHSIHSVTQYHFFLFFLCPTDLICVD